MNVKLGLKKGISCRGYEGTVWAQTSQTKASQPLSVSQEKNSKCILQLRLHVFCPVLDIGHWRRGSPHWTCLKEARIFQEKEMLKFLTRLGLLILPKVANSGSRKWPRTEVVATGRAGPRQQLSTPWASPLAASTAPHSPSCPSFYFLDVARGL